MSFTKSLLFSLVVAAGATACSHDASNTNTTPSTMDGTSGNQMTQPTPTPTSSQNLPSNATDPAMTPGPNQPGTSTGTMGPTGNSQDPNTASPNTSMPPPNPTPTPNMMPHH